MKGWYKESYRHYLAAKGISTKRYMKNKYLMASTLAVPHWLLNKLDEEQREEAEKMLFEQNIDAGEVAKHFGLKHPGTGVKRRPYAVWTDEQKIKYIQDLRDKLGRTPLMTDIPKDEGIPGDVTFGKAFGSWNNLLREAGMEPTRREKEPIPVKKLLDEFGVLPTGKDERDMQRNLIPGEKEKRNLRRVEYPGHKERYDEYNARPEVKENKAEYNRTPKRKQQMKEYRQRPEIRERERLREQQEEYKERKKEYNQRPEVKKRKAELNKLYRERKLNE